MARAVDPLAVDANLDVTIGEDRCAVWDEDGRLVVNAPTFAAARSLLDGVDAIPGGQQRLTEELSRAALTVEVRVRHAPVARIGPDVRPSSLADVLGYDAEFSPRGVATAAWRALL